MGAFHGFASAFGRGVGTRFIASHGWGRVGRCGHVLALAPPFPTCGGPDQSRPYQETFPLLMRVRSTFGPCVMYMLYYTNMSHCDPGLLQDWEYHACW